MTLDQYLKDLVYVEQALSTTGMLRDPEPPFVFHEGSLPREWIKEELSADILKKLIGKDHWYRALRKRESAWDKVHYFTNPDSDWQNLAGRAGVAIVRDGWMVVGYVELMVS